MRGAHVASARLAAASASLALALHRRRRRCGRVAAALQPPRRPVRLAVLLLREPWQPPMPGQQRLGLRHGGARVSHELRLVREAAQ
jgi:hypothetical protein